MSVLIPKQCWLPPADLPVEAQVTARSQPEWRSRFFHLAMRRRRKIAKVAMASKLAVRLCWMWRRGWDYGQFQELGSHASPMSCRFDTVHTVFTLFVDIDKVRLLFGPEYVLISARGPSLSRLSTACCVASGATLQIKCVHAFTGKTKRSSLYAQSDF